MPSTPSPTGLAIPDLPAQIGSGRQAFLHSLSQHERLIGIDTPFPPDALLVEQFHGREAMSELFGFEVDCLATSAHYALKELIGEEVSLRLRLADGSRRSLHGFVSTVQQLGSDGALARYRLVLVPWLHALTQRSDSYVFQDKSVLDILDEVFRDYPFACYRFDVGTALPKRSVAMQYRETDYAFVARLLAEEGLNFFFEHLDDETATASEDNGRPQARHRLVVFDNNASLPPCSQPAIRFHRADAAETSDTITQLAEQRQVQPNAVALSSWDYKTLAAPAADGSVLIGTGESPPLEIHEGGGAYRYTDGVESERIARARTESLALAHQRMRGEGTVRALAVGSWFDLHGHAEADGEYIVLSVTHRAANNLDAGMPDIAQLGAVEHGTYCNQFTCAPRNIPIRPPYWFPKPVAPGPQVALVVGLEQEEISTERDHRIKVQFPWQRGERAAAGQGLHPATSNAPGNLAAGTWVRVAEPSAGPNWGGIFVPRIGQEVQVGFVSADIDRPVVTGQLYNDADTPPYHGADNHPGALAGIRSQEYASGGFNHWTIDDTPGQLRQSLTSSYAGTQLHMGYLIRQNDNQRSRYRGLGFELATDAWATLRAARGVFVSTAQRSGAISTQLDTREAQGKLKATAALATTLSEAAVQHHAHPLSTPHEIEAMRQTADNKASADGDSAPVFARPLALLDSAAAIAAATPASSAFYGGQDLTLTATTALRATAGEAVSVVAGKSASLFTHAGGAKLIAAKEALSVRAHTGPMEAAADKAMTLTSTAGNITVQAKQEILLASGGGYVRLAGGNVDIHCPASVSVKGASHDFLGGASKPAGLLPLPNGASKMTNWIAISYRDSEGNPMSDVGYRIKFDTGAVISGKLDAAGHARHDNVPESAATVEYDRRPPQPDSPWSPLEAMVAKASNFLESHAG